MRNGQCLVKVVGFNDVVAAKDLLGFSKGAVRHSDVAVRASRIGLLQAISALQTGRADLSFLNGF